MSRDIVEGAWHEGELGRGEWMEECERGGPCAGDLNLKFREL